MSRHGAPHPQQPAPHQFADSRNPANNMTLNAFKAAMQVWLDVLGLETQNVRLAYVDDLGRKVESSDDPSPAGSADIGQQIVAWSNEYGGMDTPMNIEVRLLPLGGATHDWKTAAVFNDAATAAIDEDGGADNVDVRAGAVAELLTDNFPGVSLASLYSELLDE